MADTHKKRKLHVEPNFNGSPVERGEHYRQNLTASDKHHDFSGAIGEHDHYETPDVASEHNPNWIKGAIKHPGALHKQLGVAEGEKIPAKKMAAARAGKYGPKAEKRAHLAKTLSKF